MKRTLFKFLFALVFFGSGILLGYFVKSASTPITETVVSTITPKPLLKYRILELAQAHVYPGVITRDEPFDIGIKAPTFDTYLFSMHFYPALDGVSKKTTGMLNIPKEEGTYPLAVMIRGYVDPTIYQTGVGTKNASTYLASSGYITIAPDFLGYAGSDSEAGNIFETRFQTYTTMIALIKAIKEASFQEVVDGKWDGKNIVIWAHSNGGQVALTTLSILGESIPTVLWAPVTKPFPYSILYYTDESMDGGKLIRSELSKFESVYGVDEYSFTNYLERISAPIILFQGTQDDAIPVAWSQGFVNTMKKGEHDIELVVYPADHNMRGAWDEAMARSLAFFKRHEI